MSKQRVKIEPIEVPDIFAERTPFWYARLKTTQSLYSLNKNKTIQVGNRLANTNLSMPESCIAGEVHGFTSSYRFPDPDSDLSSMCQTCDEYGCELSNMVEYENKHEFERMLKHFAEHIVGRHPPKILLQGA